MTEITVKGDIKWVRPKMDAVEWVENPNGKYRAPRFEYNWLERLLMRLKWMKPPKQQYVVGIDPHLEYKSAFAGGIVGPQPNRRCKCDDDEDVRENEYY